MERISISSLTYRGSIPEAILQSKYQKKLFLVYLSGENEESAELEKSTWSDSKVAESISKYCIFLHIRDGSTDAANFSAIYPQKSAPCITAIGYNGVQLWQNEGFVTKEVLATSLEKAWLSLHIQETTATVLTAALASKKSEPSSSDSSDIGPSGQGSSSGTVVPSPLVDTQAQSSEVGPLVDPELIKENKSHEHTAEETKIKLDDNASSKSSSVHKSQTVGDEQSTCSTGEDKKLNDKMSSEPINFQKSQNVVNEQLTCPTGEDKELSTSSIIKPDKTVTDRSSSGVDDGLLSQEKVITHQSGGPRGDSELTILETNKTGRDKKAECTDDMRPKTSDGNTRASLSSDVHLNIRLPDGVSLQEKFSVTSTLRMVKDYVDRNQASGIGTYDLAIPYPRKIFNDQDLSKSLSELGLLCRQALIVVPCHRATSYPRGGSSSGQAATSTDNDPLHANDVGYFAHVKRILSYVNPLSYFGGSASSSSSGQAQTGVWEYSPNSTPQNNTARMDRPYSSYSPNPTSSATGRDDSSSRQPTSRFGSNIHTLKHDEDDGRFNDRNSFWNGNSTQYGGNNDGK